MSDRVLLAADLPDLPSLQPSVQCAALDEPASAGSFEQHAMPNRDLGDPTLEKPASPEPDEQKAIARFRETTGDKEAESLDRWE
jgi:hypothetical protein